MCRAYVYLRFGIRKLLVIRKQPSLGICNQQGSHIASITGLLCIKSFEKFDKKDKAVVVGKSLNVPVHP